MDEVKKLKKLPKKDSHLFLHVQKMNKLYIQKFSKSFGLTTSQFFDFLIDNIRKGNDLANREKKRAS